MKTRRYSPDELYARFKEAHDFVSPREFYNRPTHKKTQEIYCAARFGQALSQVHDCWLLVADGDEQTVADFYLEVAGKVMPFQITEVQFPRRRRGEEYKQKEPPQATLESWDSGEEHGPVWIREAVKKKYDRYGGKVEDLNLLVYANYCAPEHDFEEICRATADVTFKFASVWIVNGNRACCIKGGDTLGPARPWLFGYTADDVYEL